MSSFQRKIASSALPPPSGTRASSGSSLFVLSTGIPSLDDILGSGQPLGSVLTVLTPDPHSAWGELVQRYYVAQGVASDHSLCLIGGDSSCRRLVEGCMWMTKDNELDSNLTQSLKTEGEDEDEEPQMSEEKVKIAWRYETMKKFETTVGTTPNAIDKFSHVFDLTLALPKTKIDEVLRKGHLTFIDSSMRQPGGQRISLQDTLLKIKALINSTSTTSTTTPLRICVPDLGGPEWGDLSSQAILRFLFALRQTVQSTMASVLITLPPHLSTNNPRFTVGHPEHEWIQKLAFISDGCITLNSFGTDPSLASMFPTYNGLVRIHSTPSLRSLVPPSHKHSLLRGLSSPSNHSAGGGENNLGFRCTRKRFVIETLHLDVEGGVSERRTAPPILIHEDHKHSSATHQPDQTEVIQSGLAAVQLEAPVSKPTQPSPKPDSTSSSFKPKKRVGFQSDRPSLYDF